MLVAMNLMAEGVKDRRRYTSAGRAASAGSVAGGAAQAALPGHLQISCPQPGHLPPSQSIVSLRFAVVSLSCGV